MGPLEAAILHKVKHLYDPTTRISWPHSKPRSSPRCGFTTWGRRTRACFSLKA